MTETIRNYLSSLSLVVCYLLLFVLEFVVFFPNTEHSSNDIIYPFNRCQNRPTTNYQFLPTFDLLLVGCSPSTPLVLRVARRLQF